MDLANVRRQGVRSLIAYCLNDACRHQAIIDVSSYPGETPVPWFRCKTMRPPGQVCLVWSHVERTDTVPARHEFQGYGQRPRLRSTAT
jgi:hypothetical protein